MDLTRILDELREERGRIDEAIIAIEALDSAEPKRRRRGQPVVHRPAHATKKPRRFSAAARKRQSEAMKKRWAEKKKAKLKEATTAKRAKPIAVKRAKPESASNSVVA